MSNLITLIIWLIWVIGVAIIAIVILPSDTKIKEGVKILLYYIAIFLTAIWTILNTSTSSGSYNSKKYTLDTEIRQEIVDGRVMKSDTVYIIEYKKPNKK